mgnify:CR=1 FL=1
MYNRYLRVTLPRFTSFLSRHKVASCLCALFLFYVYLAIRGPQGLQAWSQKRAEIKQLEQQVAAMRALESTLPDVKPEEPTQSSSASEGMESTGTLAEDESLNALKEQMGETE